MIGGERLRDKNSHDYLETIRENEGLLMNGRPRVKNHMRINESSDEDSSLHRYEVKSDGQYNMQS